MPAGMSDNRLRQLSQRIEHMHGGEARKDCAELFEEVMRLRESRTPFWSLKRFVLAEAAVLAVAAFCIFAFVPLHEQHCVYCGESFGKAYYGHRLSQFNGFGRKCHSKCFWKAHPPP